MVDEAYPHGGCFEFISGSAMGSRCILGIDSAS
jgi:hypothetical protein